MTFWSARVVSILEMTLLWTLILSGIAVMFAIFLGLLAIPVDLMWQGGWTAMAGLLVWVIFQTFSNMLNKRR